MIYLQILQCFKPRTNKVGEWALDGERNNPLTLSTTNPYLTPREKTFE